MSLQQFGKGALRVAKNYTLRFSDTQTKVRDATSNALWGPSGTEMNYIAQLSYNQNDFVDIMEMLDKRLNDKGKNWRHVFKSLVVLDYLLLAGSENVVFYFRDNLYIINALKEFQYVGEDGKDYGANVRVKAKDVSDLLSDTGRLREVRGNRASMHDRVVRGPSMQEDEEDESLANQLRKMERDDDELRRAIDASKQALAEERQRGERPSIPGGHDNKPSDSSLGEHGKSGPLRSATHGKDRDDDLLEVEVPSDAPAAEFDFDEPPSPGSSARREDEVPPPDAPHAIAQLSDTIPVIYPPLTCAEKHLDIVESSQGITKFKEWLQMRTKKGNKEPTSHQPGRVPRKSRRHADRRSPSQSPARLDPINGGPSWMAAGQRVPRMVATSPEEPKAVSSSSLYARIRQALQPQLPSTEDAHASRPNEDASRTRQGSANPQEVGPAQQANDASHPSGGGVHLTRKSGKATLRLSMTFPGWMCCGSGTEDEMHSSE